MAYTPYGWQNPYYPPPMQDNLMQMRQMQQPQMQSQIPQALQNPVAQSGVQWVSLSRFAIVQQPQERRTFFIRLPRGYSRILIYAYYSQLVFLGISCQRVSLLLQ